MKKVRPISRNQRLQNSFLYQMEKLWNEFNHLLEEPITKKGKEMINPISLNPHFFPGGGRIYLFLDRIFEGEGMRFWGK